MDERWEKVREIFDSAISCQPEERQKFVLAACGGDESLFVEVESLLESLDIADDFLETPITAQVADIINPGLSTLNPGTLFNHYEIVKQIGAGGMGNVYLARDTKLDRKVAIKILNEKFAHHESNLKRFIKEAKAASILNHPNILIIHEFGENSGRHFIVSEYVKGKTLREFLKQDAIQISQVLDIAIEIANALSAAHESGLVHRDIKPENIIVRPDGFIKVLDFGLAKLVKNENQLFIGSNNPNVTQTAKGVILGTVSYMSPEQAKGEQVDERTDVFSLGVVIYEMLTGRTPFAGDSNSETFANLINKEPPPPGLFAENIPDQIERVVLKMLSKNKDNRYPSMKTALADLKELKSGSVIHENTWRIARRTNSETGILNPPTNEEGNKQTDKIQDTFQLNFQNHKLSFALISALLIIATIGIRYYFSNTVKSGEIIEQKSIAVLPLKPINTSNRDEIYEIGIADSLIQRLGSIKSFIVRPLSAVRRYADVGQDPITAGKEQQVDYVLASNYQIADGKIRITSELLNVESGQIEETYKSEKNASDVFAMQDAVAAELGNLLRKRFNFTQNSSAKNRGTDNEEAYRLYLQGLYFNDKRLPPDGEKAVEFFEKAVQADPNYARAWAGVAFAHRSLMDIGADVNYQEQHQISMEAVNKALALDPNLSEAYTALCLNKLNYEYDFDGAETACKRAIELDPNSPLAHNTYARLLFSSGKKRFDEAISEIKTAIDLDPTSFYHQIVYTVALTYARRYDEAVQQLERLGQRNPQPAVSYYWLVGGVAFQGKQAEDFERLTRFQKLSKTDEETVKIFLTAYQTGGWQGVLQQQAKRSFGYNPMFYFFACLYAQIGEKDKALEFLEKTLERREHWSAYLEVDPRFDSMRDDPRFEALVKKVQEKQF